MTEDEKYMGLALSLARRAYGMTSPNPMVGAVVVKNGVVIGKGYHHQAGQPHAEPMAIADAEKRHHGELRGSTLYVTLEPCTTYGRTPPCSEKIIASGIKRVVIGAMDANPKHAGAAVSILQGHGIQVDCNVLEEKCRALNESFFWWITKKRPFVLLKMAMTLDGKIATQNGDAKWVSCAASRQLVQKMRRWADAVMVGGNTARLDNPSLLVRSPANWKHQPRRLVWTSKPLPAECAMLTDGGTAPELVKPIGRSQWLAFLDKLGAEDVTALLLEGGGELAAAALQAGIVNKVAFFIAPKLLCGRDSKAVVAGENPALMSEALKLDNVKVQKIGEDLLLTADVMWAPPRRPH